ncbi:MAG: efflux RND transporter periplasmic adaptor subunit [Planctomycetes bacterium]|nr:efflux RND transporter periplasmic adaptor subunit [Planctomycetota bacterium]
MAFDLDQLRLDIPTESPGPPAGVRSVWRATAIMLFTACLALIAWSFFVPRTDSGAVVVPVHVVAPLTATDLTAFTAGGWVEPAWPSPTVVSAVVDGRLDTLHVVEGQSVVKGEVIATLYNQVYRDSAAAAEARVAAMEAEVEALQAALARLRAGTRLEEIAVAQAELRTAQAQLKLMEAGYREEEVAQLQAQLEATRVRAAFLARQAERSQVDVDKTVTRAVADRDRSAANEALADVRGLEARLKWLQAGHRPEEVDESRAAVSALEARLKLLQAGTRAEELTEAEARLDAASARLEVAEADHAAAQRAVSYCLVKAPHDGIVLDILAPQGSWLHGEKRSIVRLYDPQQMQARVDVRQENATSLEIGQPCSVKLESRKGRPYGGRLLRIDPQGNLARDTVRVHVAIEEPDAMLRLDLTVTVDFLEREASRDEAPLVLPPAAVTKRDGANCVFVVRGGVAHLTVVQLGPEAAGGTTVLGGVTAGEIVATGNLALLADGTPVRLKEETS